MKKILLTVFSMSMFSIFGIDDREYLQKITENIRTIVEKEWDRSELGEVIARTMGFIESDSSTSHNELTDAIINRQRLLIEWLTVQGSNASPANLFSLLNEMDQERHNDLYFVNWLGYILGKASVYDISGDIFRPFSVSSRETTKDLKEKLKNSQTKLIKLMTLPPPRKKILTPRFRFPLLSVTENLVESPRNQSEEPDRRTAPTVVSPVRTVVPAEESKDSDLRRAIEASSLEVPSASEDAALQRVLEQTLREQEEADLRRALEESSYMFNLERQSKYPDFAPVPTNRPPLNGFPQYNYQPIPPMQTTPPGETGQTYPYNMPPTPFFPQPIPEPQLTPPGETAQSAHLDDYPRGVPYSASTEDEYQAALRDDERRMITRESTSEEDMDSTEEELTIPTEEQAELTMQQQREIARAAWLKKFGSL